MNHRVEVALDKLQYVFYIAIVAALISFFIPCQHKDKHEGALHKLNICTEVQEIAEESDLLNDQQIEDMVSRCLTQGS